MKKIILISLSFCFISASKTEVFRFDQFDISAMMHGIPVRNLRALAEIESTSMHECNGRKHCINGVVVSDEKSPKPAIGIMQMKQETANDRNCGDLYNKSENIECAARQMAWLRKKYCRTYTCIIGSYHDGGRGWKRGGSKEGRWHVVKFWRVMK